MATNELEMFLGAWDREAENTLKLLRALPPTQYDFRPDGGGRSLGELAWHLAEGDAYMSYGIEQGQFTMHAKPPNIERPRTVEGLAQGYQRIHHEAVARIRKSIRPPDRAFARRSRRGQAPGTGGRRIRLLPFLRDIVAL